MPHAISYLVLTVLFEVFGTACIQASQQFTRLWPSIGVVVGYGLAFWFLAQALRHLPLGIVYACWSGMGIVLTTVVGAVIFGQRIDTAGLGGMALIVTGIVVMSLYSTARA
jgi:small multidrug resistance pump